MNEILQPTSSSRRFGFDRRVALSDTDLTGRLRFDACARYLQDVAAFDAIEADVAHIGNWVLKQNSFSILRFPTYGQLVHSTTYLTGSGRAWVERTSVISDKESGEDLIRAKAIWVLTNLNSGAPITIPDLVYEIWGPLALQHKISVRTGKRPSLPPDMADLNWQFRFSDQDVLAHLNNATYLETIEEVLYLGNIYIRPEYSAKCDVTYRESTSCQDPAQVYFKIESSPKITSTQVYFADKNNVRTDISLEIFF